jgi:hypothetical protein
MPILVQLDRPREIKWTPRAQLRNASLDRPVSERMSFRRANRPYVLAASIWAALVDRDAPWEDPTELGEYLVTPEQQLAAWRAVNDMFAAEKKSQPNAGSSVSGPLPSSTVTQPNQTGGASALPSAASCGAQPASAQS